jgi:hypothetical protein
MPDLSPAEIQAVIQRYVSWREKVQADGCRVEGHKPPMARPRDARAGWRRESH